MGSAEVMGMDDDRCKGCEYREAVRSIATLLATFPPSLSSPIPPPISSPYSCKKHTLREGECEGEGGYLKSIQEVLGYEYGDRFEQLTPKTQGTLLRDLAGPTFPGIDVPHELRKAAAWERANPQRRKTWRGLPRFLIGWMSRAQDRARARAPARRPADICIRCGTDISAGYTLHQGAPHCDRCYAEVTG